MVQDSNPGEFQCQWSLNLTNSHYRRPVLFSVREVRSKPVSIMPYLDILNKRASWFMVSKHFLRSNIHKAVISPLSMDSSQSSTTLCNAVCVECFRNADWSVDIKL